MDATTPFASGTTANFRAGFVRGWGLKYVEVDRAKDGIRSAGRSLSNKGYCCHHHLRQLSPPSPHFLNTSRPSIGRLAPKRELLEP